MPIYAYKCKNCDYRFEAKQRFSDETLTGCPRCQGNLRRVISLVGVVFKGSGFYVTDNRNGSSKSITNGAATKADEKTKEPKETSEPSPAASTKESDSKSKTDSAN
ncbi:MAG TPA: FmdB family zinc ribbon protein [candidate division Zixibacteria bacterium]|nr:FmdB family zinc ribbon protein [candidate division Zixibacteria bacterium]